MSASNDKKKILLIAANPKDTNPLNLPKEFRDIEEGIELAKNRDLFTIEQIGATRYRDLRRKLVKYQPHIIHFSGHGIDSGIILEDDQGYEQIASAENLTELLQLTDQQQQLECVVLNTCHSQATAKALSHAFLHTIGMDTSIADKAAIVFAITFYEAIGDGRSYHDAFKLGRNAVKHHYDQPNNDDTFAMPQFFSQSIASDAQTLTHNEQHFIQQIFSQRNQGVPQMILSQEGRDTSLMAKQLKQFAQQHFAEQRIFHLHPPVNPNASEEAYFRRLGRQCRFKAACYDSTEWAGLLEDELANDQPLFLLINDFEKGSDAARRALASELRQLQEMHNRQLKIIIFGGEKLAEQFFVTGDLSFLNNANTQYVPELQWRDIKEMANAQQLDKQTLDTLLNISGGHPKIIRYLISMEQQTDYRQALQQSTLPSEWFTRYKQDKSGCAQLCDWLQQEILQPFEDWPMDSLLRDLYWSNLVMRKNNQFCWRSEVIRDMGCKVLAC